MRTVTTTGYGAAAAVPDSAVVRLAVAHQAPSLAEALAGVESGRAALVAALAAAAPAPVIGSTGLSVWPATDDHGLPAGFSAEHSMTLRCSSLDDAGRLVGDAVGAVGDRLRIHGVSQVVSDPTSALAAARDLAWDDAHARATRLAQLAEGSLGQVETVVEGAPPGTPVPRGAVLSAKAVGFEPGETTLDASVTITWQLT